MHTLRLRIEPGPVARLAIQPFDALSPRFNGSRAVRLRCGALGTTEGPGWRHRLRSENGLEHHERYNYSGCNEEYFKIHVMRFPD